MEGRWGIRQAEHAPHIREIRNVHINLVVNLEQVTWNTKVEKKEKHDAS